MEREARKSERAFALRGVESVADNGVINGFEMSADLMCPSGLGENGEIANPPGACLPCLRRQAIEYLIFCNRFPQCAARTALCRPEPEIRRTPSNGAVNDSFVLLHLAIDKRPIFLLHIPPLELLLYMQKRFLRFGNNENPRCFSINSMHDAGAVNQGARRKLQRLSDSFHLRAML